MSAAKSILIVTTEALWPVRASGLSVRCYPVLKRLAENHLVDVLITGDPKATLDDPLLLRLKRVINLPATPRPTFSERLSMLAKAFSPFGLPYEFMRHSSGQVKKAVSTMLKDHHYDAMYWVGADDALRQMPRLNDMRVTCDLIDSPYLYYSRSRKLNLLSRMLPFFRPFDLGKARRWERSFIRNPAYETVFISPVDANAAGANSRSYIIPNGIYADIPYAPDFKLRGNCIGFLGNMSYQPNIEGAMKLYRDVFLPLKHRRPDLTLKIIGRDPVPEIQALAGNGVAVTGTVANIWDHVRDADVFVFPMLSGSGLQNKILEAMFAGKPVVTTPICHASVGGRLGQELLVGWTDAELVNAVDVLLSDSRRYEQIARAGNVFVRERYDVDRTVARLEGLIVR